MLVVKFVIQDKYYTWFIHDNWVSLLSVLLPIIAVTCFKSFKRLKFKQKFLKKPVPNPRGGQDMVKCIDVI